METPLTVGELAKLLSTLDQTQKLVFTDVYYGDFDVIGAVGSCLSEDNFQKDRRPLIRLQKRDVHARTPTSGLLSNSK